MHKRGLVTSLVFLISIYSVFAIMGHDPSNVFPGQFNGNFTFNGTINVTGNLLADGSRLQGVRSDWNLTSGTLFPVNHSVNMGIGTSNAISKLTVAGNITPDANNTYSLGTPDRVWKDIFVSNGSLWIGGSRLSSDGGVLKWGGQDVAAIGSEAPVGTILSYASSGVIPNGWLECDGRNISRALYSELFSSIGTTYGAADGVFNFTLPDLRGVFLRGNDSGRGLDAGRVLGSYQDDSFQGHKHSLESWASYDGNGYANTRNQGYGAAGPYGDGIRTVAIYNDGSNGEPRTTTETRPDNVAVKYIIKAKYQGATGGNTGASPSFRAHKNTVTQPIADNSWVKVTWPYLEFDTNNDFNTTGNYFRPTIPGKYLLTASAYFQAMSDTDQSSITIYKNGVEYARGNQFYSGAGGGTAASVSAVVDANGINDYFEIYVAHDHGSNINLDGGSYTTYFSGSRIDGGNGLWTREASGNISYNAGNVGIGTATPYFKLSVEGDNGNGYIASFANDSSSSKLMIRNSNGTVGVQAVSSTVSAAKNLTLNPLGGNVGIGITNPTQKLTVVGNANITGNVSAYNLGSGAFSQITASRTTSSGTSAVTDCPTGTTLVFWGVQHHKVCYDADGGWNYCQCFNNGNGIYATYTADTSNSNCGCYCMGLCARD